MPKYPPEMDLVPNPPKYKPLTFQSYMGKSSAYQHIVHFKSQLGGMPDLDALKIKSFIGAMKGAPLQTIAGEFHYFMGSIGRKAFSALPRGRPSS